MLGQLLAKVIGTQNDRELKRLRPLVEQVNGFEPGIKALSDHELKGKTVHGEFVGSDRPPGSYEEPAGACPE